MIEQPIRKPHIYELDPLRAVTALGVVAVHVVAFTVFLNHSTLGNQLQNALVVALHFTRAVFMFLTAFAMVYVYYGKPFAFKRFWKKRSLGVLLPYCIWSILYVWENTPGKTPIAFITNTLSAIATGNASYQMYYILLTLQFYLILPAFLLFLKLVAHHPWRVLCISFVLQVALFYVDYQFLQQGTLASSGIWQGVVQYQDRFVLVYQFYFVVGGLTALYFRQVRSFLLRNGVVVFCVFLVSLAALWIHFALQVRVYQEPMAYVTSVLQPIMVFYSLAVIVCSFWLTSLWAKRRNQAAQPEGYRFWHLLSDSSFGIYLLQAFFITALLKWVVPIMPTVWPVALRVFLIWFLAAGGATALSMLLLRVPILSRLVGREYAAQRTPDPQQERVLTPEGTKQEQHAL